MNALSLFHRAVAAWIERTFAAPTAVACRIARVGERFGTACGGRHSRRYRHPDVVVDERAVVLAVRSQTASHPKWSWNWRRNDHRAKIKECHPDKVMGLAREFQELANRKTANHVPGASACLASGPKCYEIQTDSAG
jgi:hypothetical protein